MSRDTDANQRLWISLGYGGKTAPKTVWRYWKHRDGHWVIASPNDLAHFEQHGRTIKYNGEVVIEAKTQWSATWLALAYFYSQIVQTLPKPPIGHDTDA